MKASGKNIPSILNVLASQNLILSGSTVFLLVFGLFVAVRFWHPAYYCLDGDEIFSLNIARDSWSNLLPAVGSDLVHPPLSYFLLKAWVSIGGDGILWLAASSNPIIGRIRHPVPSFVPGPKAKFLCDRSRAVFDRC